MTNRELALLIIKRSEEFDPKNYKTFLRNGCYLSGLFIWSETPEGHYFWFKQHKFLKSLNMRPYDFINHYLYFVDNSNFLTLELYI